MVRAAPSPVQTMRSAFFRSQWFVSRKAEVSTNYSSRPRARLPRAVVRRTQVGKLGEQIVVRADPISRHFPTRNDRQEGIGGVVAECAAIVRVGRRARGVIVQQV